ncbi:MAG TPA: DUF4142 domain-containing protein [Gemmatimonadaceae bacterium]|nr:DUF4142 domain-containing protein [Gemmatimonadaceae bacterium]
MRVSFIAAALAAGMALAPGAGAQDTTHGTGHMTKTPPAKSTTRMTDTTHKARTTTHRGGGSVTQAEILGALITADSGEMRAADVVLKKKVNDRVHEYAKQLRDDHEANAKKAHDLAQTLKITPTHPENVVAIRTKARTLATKLEALDGTALEKAYVDAMVKDHNEDLKLIDDKWLPAARNADLKKLLEETRTAVQQHLDKAKSIQ